MGVYRVMGPHSDAGKFTVPSPGNWVSASTKKGVFLPVVMIAQQLPTTTMFRLPVTQRSLSAIRLAPAKLRQAVIGTKLTSFCSKRRRLCCAALTDVSSSTSLLQGAVVVAVACAMIRPYQF